MDLFSKIWATYVKLVASFCFCFLTFFAHAVRDEYLGPELGWAQNWDVLVDLVRMVSQE